MFDWSTLLIDTSAAEVKATILAYCEALGLPVTSWQPLSPTRVLADALSRVGAATQRIAVQIGKSGFKDFAEKAWLELNAKQVYNVDKIHSTFALGEFVASNASGNLYSYGPDEIVFRKVGTNKTYTNTDAVTINPFETGVSILLRAQEDGSQSNAGAGELELVTSMTGVTGTNSAPVSGLDEEEDDALRLRCDNKIEALSPAGPRGIYEYVAKTPELNGGASVTRARVLPPPGDGSLTVVVASSIGPIPPGDVLLVQEGIDTWAAPITVNAIVTSATGLGLSYDVTVWEYSQGAPADDVLVAAVKASLIDYINRVPIGGIEFAPGVGVIPWRGVLGAVENTLVGQTKPLVKAVLSIETDISMLPTDVAILLAGSINVTVVKL